MQQSKNNGKMTVIGIVIACICIIVYLGALVSVIVRVNAGMEQRRLIADQEFYDIADLASSAGLLGFMDETFREIIQKALEESITLEGIIISGPNGEYGFEKSAGKALNYENNLPRFRNRIDFSKQPLYLPLRIQGLRNVNIQAVAGALDYTELSGILKQTLLLVVIALALAFFTLLLESLRKKHFVEINQKDKIKPADVRDETVSHSVSLTGKEKRKTGFAADNSYSTRGRIIREENTGTRLMEELHRCAATDHDLSFIMIEFKSAIDDTNYARFAADAARFFSSKDFICEKGERGISVICPGLNLDAGFLNAGEFHTRVMGKYPDLLKSKTDLCMGLSARCGRSINAERLIFEAEEALERALMDPVSHIVAFKSDPEKYRNFVESRGYNE